VNVKPFSSPSQCRLFLTEAEVLGWIGQALSGERLTYYRGFLALDRTHFTGRLSERDASELSRVADIAWLAAQHGLGHLVQKRNSAGNFDYVIVARENKADGLSALLRSLANRTSLAGKSEVADAA
jgi:hypothetical protein